MKFRYNILILIGRLLFTKPASYSLNCLVDIYNTGTKA